MDTCGLAQPDDVLAVAALTDLFLYDLKFMDDAKHRRYAGVSNALILENLKALGRAQSRIWLRVPIIPGINDAPTDLQAAARFAATVSGVQQVNLLPFHRTGLPKARRLGQDNGLAGVEPPSDEAMSRAVDIFANAGLAVKTGG